MKRVLITGIMLVVCNLTVFSQKEPSKETEKRAQIADSPSIWDKLYFGGNFGASFGTNTNVELSPLVGYKITKELSAGLGITYIYMSYNYYGTSYSWNAYGGRAFARYQILENFFAYTEYEVLNTPDLDFNQSNPNRRRNVDSPLVGGGYSSSLGANSHYVIMLLWNLNPTIYTPYTNPIIRVGFTFGL